MYCRNYTGTVSHVLCGEVCYTVSLFGRVHYRRSHCIYEYVCIKDDRMQLFIILLL